MARPSDGPKLHRRPGRQIYSVRFTHRGRGVELSTKSSDRDLAEQNAWAIYERVTSGVRYLRPRGLSLPRLRFLGVVPIALLPQQAGMYFAWCPLLPEFIKIGWSSNVRRRIRHLSTGLPGPLFLLAIVPGAADLERSLHRELTASRVRGEWFRADAAVLAHVQESIQGRRDPISGTLSLG